MMTSKEFAKLIGVSQPTVSRAMNNSDLVPLEKRKYIRQKAKEYGFVLNSQAKSLKTNKTGTIGILFPRHFIGMNENMMLAHIYDCIQKEMNQYDYDIMVIYYDKQSDDFSSFERIVKKRKVDGFLVLRMELSDQEMELIADYHVPCVFMMNAGAQIRENLNYFFSDSEYGGYLVGQYFGSFKDYHKMFVAIEEEKGDAQRRYKGYSRGLSECGCSLEDKDIIYCSLGMDAAYQAVMDHRDLISSRKTAIFAYSDILGIGIVNACRDIGLQLPQDVQVIGMDDIPLSVWNRPMLSTVHVKVEEMVPKGCGKLIELIEKKGMLTQEWIRPELILRETTMEQR